MIEKNQESQTLNVELTQAEGRDLWDFVERLIEEHPSGRALDRLEEMEERIGDAHAAAVWLRENVQLELNLEDMYDLLEGLVARSETDETDETADAPLHIIEKKLRSMVKRGGVRQGDEVLVATELPSPKCPSLPTAG